MTGYTPKKHDDHMNPPDIISVDECKVCQTRHDVGDMERLDGGYVCKKCQPDYKPLCDECGHRFPLAQITLVKRPWATYQFCPADTEALGYGKKEGEE